MSHISIVDDKVWCPYCNDHKKFVKTHTAATLADVTRRTIYRYIEEGKVYSIKTAGGTYRVCSGCLLEPETQIFTARKNV